MRPYTPPSAPDAQATESLQIPADNLVGQDDEHGYTRPSKSQQKRDALALQELGRELVEQPRDRLARLPLSEELSDAIRTAQRIRSHEARRRQLQYIGKLMRDVDPAPLRQALDKLKGVSAVANAELHRLEKLRALLLQDEAAALAQLTHDYPQATSELQQLRQLRRNALKEQQQNKPPRAYREIFQYLKNLADANTPDEPTLMADEDEDEHE